MIETLELENFKSHRHTKLVFDGSRLHAIVGQNSSGKTSILQALYYFKKLVDSLAENIFINESSPKFITTYKQDNTRVSIRCSEDNKQLIWKALYNWKEYKRVTEIVPMVEWELEKVNINTTLSKSKEGIEFDEAPQYIKDFLKSTAYLKLVAGNLAKPGYSEDVAPRIDSDGSGLAPTLDYIRSEDIDRFQFLQKMLQKIVPTVKKVEIRRAKVEVKRERIITVDGRSIAYEENQEMLGQEVYLSMDSGDRIPAHAISEGTMLTLGLLTVLMNPDRPSLVLLDDVEQGLHPKAQRELITVFKKILEINPDLQIIFTTHSPYIIDELTPSQVHVLSTTKSGFTRAKRLDEHPDVEWAKQTLTTGEFWDAEGEDWVLDGEIDG